ncbi:unnamed protein product [Mytilus edulis]|uniref:Uncharacterized protein n=1 Tax=Mytilus edulis TaxID=6550 RepID=A0A8S3RSW9_MYTED|nr:unnamed protein product [Mytilus edulis]
MSDAFQLVRPDNLEPLTMSRKSKEHARSSITTIDEPFSSPMKDNQESDPSYQPLSPSSDDSDEQEIISVPSKALRMLKFMNICGISMSSYINHQKCYLYPAIGHVWHNYQNDYANDIQQQQRSVTLGGDGRADTPGHSANSQMNRFLEEMPGFGDEERGVESSPIHFRKTFKPKVSTGKGFYENRIFDDASSSSALKSNEHVKNIGPMGWGKISAD